MYKDLEKKKIRDKKYGKIYRERKNAEAASRQTEIKKKIAAAIIAAELTQQSQESDGRELGRYSQADYPYLSS